MTKVIELSSITPVLKSMGVKFPYNEVPKIYVGGNRFRNHADFTEELWNDYVWNPPQFYEAEDPQASEKPTWEQLLMAEKIREINIAKEFAGNLLKNTGYSREPTPSFIRAELADTDTIAHGGGEVHIHGGIDRMTGLISMVEDANESGHSLPLIVMRDEDNKPLLLHTHAQIRPLLDAVRRRKNIVESAHNRVMERYQAIADVRDDETADIDDRVKAAEDALKFVEKDYKAHLEAEIAKYDPDALPADLPTLKAVYIERLEAAARKREAHFQGVLTQQGAILPPSCDEEEAAGRKVAMALRLGSIRIHAADDAAGAKSAYEAGLAAISEIHPLNIPEFLVDGKPYKSSASVKRISLSSQSLTVFIDHPQRGRLTDLNANFRVFDLDEARLRPPLTRYRPQEGETRRGFTLDLSGQAGETVRVELAARNACGPADIALEASVPAL